MSETDRAQGLVERIQEDERLRGDLSDPAATALVAWATEQVLGAAADPQRSDEDLAALAQTVRSAARTAAEAGDAPAAEVVARAQANLAQAAPAAPAPAAEAPAQTLAEPAPAEAPPAAVAALAEAVTESAASASAAVQAAPDSPAHQRPQRPQSSYTRRRRPYRAGASSGKTRKEG